MLYLVAYSIAIVVYVASAWLDRSSHDVYGSFRPMLHRTARDMDFYWQWLLPNILRCLTLIVIVGLCMALAWFFFNENPLSLGPTSLRLITFVMSLGAICLIAVPEMTSRTRTFLLLRRAASNLLEFVPVATSRIEMEDLLVPAGYTTRDGWSSWHPKDEDWTSKTYWKDLVPVAYLQIESVASVIVSVDFSHFLAWNISKEEIFPGARLPFYGPGRSSFLVTSVYKLIGRRGWTVVRAELCEDSFVL